MAVWSGCRSRCRPASLIVEAYPGGRRAGDCREAIKPVALLLPKEEGMRLASLLVFSLSIACAVWADEAPPTAPEVPRTLEQSVAQRERARATRAAAEERYEAEQNSCYGKFLVNSCLADAKRRYTESVIEARKLDQPAIEFEREERRRELEAKEAQRAADQPVRQAEEKESAERFRAEQAAKLAQREAKLADKARQAEEGRRKTAAEQAKRQAKMAKRARQDAEREAKKAATGAARPAVSPDN